MTPTKETSHQNEAHNLFNRFIGAKSCEETLRIFHDLSRCLDLQPEPDGQLQFYQKLKSRLNVWKAKALWTKLDKKASHGTYKQGQSCAKTRCLVVGAGPCGLRTAIELAFLGAKVIVVEMRESFSRNNVLHLWPFSIHDLRTLGAKQYHGHFCTGTLDHVSIRQLQLILLKTALLVGVEVFVGIKFKDALPPPAEKINQGRGWTASLQPSNPYLGQYQFDVLISAGGSKFIPDGFRRNELRGKLAIGITANFVNRHTAEEVNVAEISGVARIYNQTFFKNLLKQTGIDLENIVYYKDDTHYFVMTAKKQSLLKMGVILQDLPDTERLLSQDNVNHEALYKYARDAASFSTGYKLPQMDFALSHHQRPDVDMFDFTCMYRAENAALVRERRGARLLVGLVGDCLVEPFWPLGTGVARGFLAAYDAAWMVKKWASGAPTLEVLAERESIYQHLSQTTPENTNKNITQYSIDPTSRYPNLNLQAIKPGQVRNLYDTGYKGREHTKADTNARRATFSKKVSIDVYEELLTWCRKQTAGYRGVAVKDLTHSWRSGLALCALIHRHRPHLIDFDSLDQNAAAHNNQLAFDVAEQELGILPILTGVEMACEAEPDKLSLVTYLSQFYEAFKDEMLLPPVPPEDCAGQVKRTTLSGANLAILFLNKLQKGLSLKRNTKGLEDLASEIKDPKNWVCGTSGDSSPCLSGEFSGIPVLQPLSGGNHPGSRNSTLDSRQSEGDVMPRSPHLELVIDEHPKDHGSRAGSPACLPAPESRGQTLKRQTLSGCSDACYFCGQRVYILERVSAEGLFFHRGCFRCHQCEATLRVGNYAFNEDDGYFYCVFHLDETDAAASGADSKMAAAVDPEQTNPSAFGSSPALPPSNSSSLPPMSVIVPEHSFQPHPMSPRPLNVVLDSARSQLSNSARLPTSTIVSPVPLKSIVWAADGGDVNDVIKAVSLRPRSQGMEEKDPSPCKSELMRLAKKSRPVSAPPDTLCSQQEEDSTKSKLAKRRICLSQSEKERLSRLSLDLDSEATPQLRDRIPIKGVDEAESCEMEEESTEEEEEEEDSTDEEVMDEEELFDAFKTPVKQVIPARNVETWKVRTLQRRAKEDQMKRFCKAQSIQRRLEEIEEQFRDLEQLGIELEHSIRRDPECEEQAVLIGQWLQLVQDKNALVSEESDLMIEAQVLELEEGQSLLELQLRNYLDLDDDVKTPEDRAVEAQTLQRMLELVDKRNDLITFMDEKRLNDVTEKLHATHWFCQRPTS